MDDIRMRSLIAIPVLLACTQSMAIDLAPLWNFNEPEASERRFREALETAEGDDALILWTQVARSYGLRRDFARAREILASIEPRMKNAGAEPLVRFDLERGRTFASAAHAPESQTPEAKEVARAAYVAAFGRAKAQHLDGLAVDALHMLAFVDTAPADQLKWGREALGVVEASSQPAAKRWEASLRNNVGYALHQLGRYEEALGEFRKALRLREAGTDPWATHVARWMVAWTLRAMGRVDEALEIQLRLARERDAAGAPDPKVFEELELLRRARADSK
jgi:tetratricopeptide (TPR) repeat protein